MKIRHTVGALLLAATIGCGQSSSPTRPTSSCSYALSPTAQSVPIDGGTFTATMTTTAAGCDWTAAADMPWIAISSGSSGTTTGTIVYSVQPNSDAVRKGTIAARANGGASVTVSVTQDGVAQ